MVLMKSKVSWALSILLEIGLLSAAVVVWYKADAASYAMGHGGWFTQWPLWPLVLKCLAGSLVAICIVLGAAASIYGVATSSPPSRIASNVAIVILAFVCVVLGILLHEPAYMPFTQGLSDWARTTVDDGAIRNWLQTTAGIRAGKVDPQDWPSEIRSHAPRLVIIHPGSEAVTLMWGGGFGHWGITVSRRAISSSRVAPPAGFSVYQLKVEEGVYAWHELQ